MKLNKVIVGAVALTAAAVLSTSQPAAYSLGTAKWTITPVPIYINPQNADVTADAAEAAVLWSMNEWNTRTGTTFRWQYNGRTTQTTTGNDGKNMVVFRNSTNGSALASTYSWWSGSTRVDSDIIIWDGAYQFYTGTSGCTGSGAYIEDIASHELGHALGLAHSSVADATMLSGYRYCSQDQRTLAADDIAGAQALYSLATTTTSNTAPSVQISSPSTSSSFTSGTSITFSGSASDSQDGNLTTTMAWTSSIDGTLGYGGSFAKSLTAGSHIITAKVTDAGGLTAYKQVSLTVTAPVTSSTSTSTTSTAIPTLSASPYKIKGVQTVDLTWSGFTTSGVTVYRDGASVVSTANDGYYTNSIGKKGGGSYSYKLCANGICTNAVTVTF